MVAETLVTRSTETMETTITADPPTTPSRQQGEQQQPSGQQGEEQQSPAIKRARMEEPDDTEDVKVILGKMREKHNSFVLDVGQAIEGLMIGLNREDQHLESLRQGCAVLESKVQAQGEGLNVCGQSIVDMGIMLNAQKVEQTEGLKRVMEKGIGLEKNLYNLGQSVPQEFRQAHDTWQKSVAKLQDSFGKELEKTRADVEKMVGHAVEKKWHDPSFGAAVMGGIESKLNAQLDANMTTYLEMRVAQVYEEVTKCLSTAAEVQSAELRMLAQEMKNFQDTTTAASSDKCPCISGRCPCKCNTDPLQQNCPWTQAKKETSSPPGVPAMSPQQPSGHGGPGAPGGDHGSGSVWQTDGSANGQGRITMTTKLFDEKTAREAKYAYDGENGGDSWRSDVVDYMLSRCPDAGPWITWVEEQGATEITAESMSAKAMSLMTELSPIVLSHHMWGFLQHGLTGAARQVFKNNLRQDGFNIWRILVLEINSQTDCRRHGLRNQVQTPPQAPSASQVKQFITNWETLYTQYRDAGGKEMDFEDRRGQLLRILPGDMRKEIFKKMNEFTTIAQLKEWIRVQLELEKEWGAEDHLRKSHSRTVNTLSAEPGSTEDGPGPEDMQALMELGSDATIADILALQQRFKKFGKPRVGGGGGGGRNPRQNSSDSPPARQKSTSGEESKCVNCGKAGHRKEDCRAPAKERHLRPCFNCGQPGHIASACRSTKGGANMIEETPNGPVVNLGMVGLETREWRTIPPKQKMPELFPPRRQSSQPETKNTPAKATLGDFMKKSVFTRLAETETEDLAQEAVVNQDESISHPFLGVDDSDGRILHRLAPTPVFPRKITNRQIRYTSRWMQIFLWETGRLVR